MHNITYDVRIYKTEVYKGSKVTTYRTRWKTGPKMWREQFRNKAQGASKPNYEAPPEKARRSTSRPDARSPGAGHEPT
jgi:hypothetical protein